MTPLVLVHGFLGGSKQWDGLKAELEDGHPVIAVDLPGFGQNAHLEPIDRIEGFADWVIQYVRDRGVQGYNLLGHSMGGMIAQEIARKDKNRVQKLVLYATGSVGVLPGRFETIEESKRRASLDGAAATARRISATWFLDEEAAPRYEACAHIAEHAGAEAILAGLDAMQAWSGKDELSEIHQETLVIWGDCDRTYAWEQIQILWRGISQSSLAVIPGCAHAVHLEKPTLFNAFLDDFLRS